MNHITPIIHMTNDCNMACKYCYTGSALRTFPDSKNINNRFNFALPTLFNFLDQLIVYNNDKPTRVIFHGGEPLLINLNNWESILQHINNKAYNIKFGVQTNGLLLNDAFIELFREINMEVGVSLDGPALLNNQTRILKNGKPTFDFIFNNLLKLKKAGLNFGVLVTLNKTNINKLGEIYHFFKEHKISFTVRPIFQTNQLAQEDFHINPSDYAVSVCKLFDQWFSDNDVNTFIIEEFASIIAQFIKPIEGLVSCNFTKNCSEHYLSFDIEGNIYPCNRFYGDRAFLYGNIKDVRLDAIMNEQFPNSLSQRWDLLTDSSCRDCEVVDLCYGGCPANAYYWYGDYFAKDHYCEAYRSIFRHVYESVKYTLK